MIEWNIVVFRSIAEEAVDGSPHRVSRSEPYASSPYRSCPDLPRGFRVVRPMGKYLHRLSKMIFCHLPKVQPPAYSQEIGSFKNKMKSTQRNRRP